MILLDRFVILRYLSNFLVLFGLLFIFVISIDVIVQFDEFSDTAEEIATAEDRPYALVLLHAIVEFHGPRIFQLYAYMVGLVGVAAAGFTLAQMHKAKELVAIMASGTSLHRIAAAILAAQVGLVVVQLVDQELILPRLAPMLVRDHQQIMKSSAELFSVPLTKDANGNLLHAGSLDPATGTASRMLILVRESDGPALQRISASSGVWDPAQSVWVFTDGEMIEAAEEVRPGEGITKRSLVESFKTDLSPEKLQVRRSLQFAQLLSSSQLRSMATGGGQDQIRLDRVIYGRFSGAIVNLLMLIIAIPFFLVREPANMLQQSLRASIVVIPILIGSLATMTLQLPGLSPGVSTFLPVAVLLPIAIGRIAYLKS